MRAPLRSSLVLPLLPPLKYPVPGATARRSVSHIILNSTARQCLASPYELVFCSWTCRRLWLPRQLTAQHTFKLLGCRRLLGWLLSTHSLLQGVCVCGGGGNEPALGATCLEAVSEFIL
jgi:hypothetical protein